MNILLHIENSDDPEMGFVYYVVDLEKIGDMAIKFFLQKHINKEDMATWQDFLKHCENIGFDCVKESNPYVEQRLLDAISDATLNFPVTIDGIVSYSMGYI